MVVNSAPVSVDEEAIRGVLEELLVLGSTLRRMMLSLRSVLATMVVQETVG